MVAEDVAMEVEMLAMMFKSLIWLSLVISALGLLMSLPASALGVTPGELDFALEPDGQDTKTLHVVNDEDQTLSYRIYVDEEHKDWFTINPQEILLSPQQSGEIEITVAPPSATTGEHTAFIYITSAQPSDGLQVALGIKVRANITVNTPEYGWAIFEDNPPLAIGIIAGIVALIVGMVIRHRGLLVTGCVVVATLCGCQAQPAPEPTPTPAPVEPNNGTGDSQQVQPENSSQVRVVVTRDFGHQVMLDELVPIDSNTSAMEALREVAEIETAYGGGFVNAINSVHSGYSGSHTSKEDWFVYFNGISSNVGALDYTLHPGDTEHWDFRDWDFRQFVPAIIGDFPEPFLHGYRGVVYPTVITYQDGWEGEAREIAERLSQLGVESISSKNVDELLDDEKESSNLILLGTSDCQLIGEINQPWNKLGFYCHFENSSLKVFRSTGDLAAEYEAGVGVIQATQNPWNPKGVGVCENVVWMLSGLDETGVKNAVDTLVNHHNDFEYACAVVVAGGEVIKVPW
jgi:hypothetical protein